MKHVTLASRVMIIAALLAVSGCSCNCPTPPPATTTVVTPSAHD